MMFFKKNYSQLTPVQGGEKQGRGVCVSPEGFFGIRPTGATGFWREKMHVHIRRQHLVLGPQEEKCCLCTVLLHVGLGLCVQRGVPGEV